MLRAVGAIGIVRASNVYGSTVERQPTNGGSNASRSSRPEPADRGAERAAQPLVAAGDEDVDVVRDDVDGRHAGSLRRVDREERAVRVGKVGELLQHEPVAGRVLHVRDDDHRRLVVDVLGDLLERERGRVVPHTHEARFRAGLARDPEPGIGRARVLDVDRDDVRALERLHPPGDEPERLGRALHDRDVVAARLQKERRGVTGILEARGLGRLVEAGRAAQPDVALEGGRGLLHRERHQADRAGVQVDDLLEVGEVGSRRQGIHGNRLSQDTATKNLLLSRLRFSHQEVITHGERHSVSISARRTRAWPSSRAASRP